MPILAFLILAAQVAFVLHAIKRGHAYGWIYLIIFLPAIGCLIYAIGVVIPELRTSRAARRLSTGITNTLDPERDLRKKLDNLHVSDSVENRILLAEELNKKGLFDDAIALYRDSLRGVHEFDARLLLGLAQTYFDKNDLTESLTTLNTLKEHCPDARSQDGHLLYARALAGLHRHSEALSEFNALIPYFTGPEAKCVYGQYLYDTGDVNQAKTVFREILDTARRAPKHYAKLHKPWLSIAREGLQKAEAVNSANPEQHSEQSDNALKAQRRTRKQRENR